MNTDLIVYLTLIGGAAIGFILGRIEKNDSYVKGYKRGKEIGQVIGRMEAMENLYGQK